MDRVLARSSLRQLGPKAGGSPVVPAFVDRAKEKGGGTYSPHSRWVLRRLESVDDDDDGQAGFALG